MADQPDPNDPVVFLLNQAGVNTAGERMALEEMKLKPDRMVAIMAAAMVDARLSQMLRWVITGRDKKSEQFLDDIDVWTFSVKSRFGHACGFYGPVTLKDLGLIGKVRNKFAHKAMLSNDKGEFEPLTFQSQQIADWCRELSACDWAYSRLKREPLPWPRLRYVVSCLMNIWYGLATPHLLEKMP